MSGAGRPLRFVGYVLGGWVLLRVSLLMPEAAELTVPSLTAQAASVAVPAAGSVDYAKPVTPALVRHGPSRGLFSSAPGALFVSADRAAASALPSISISPVGATVAAAQDSWSPSPRRSIVPAASGAARFSGAAWLVARDGGRTLSDAGQLGGSQAGVRLRYALGEARTLAATVRVSTPLRGSGSEAALGFEWRPASANVAMIAEQRFGIDGTADGQAVFVVGGIGPTSLAAGLIVEGYGQAGAVARGGTIEGFADGALRLTRPILPGVTVGAGAWGGAQRDAQRLDLGPTATIALPVAGQSLRLSVDWRQRLAGKAAPGSGLAVTLGTDF
ncbi:hypothetical protein [Sphingomonas sp. 37zxx]|uniref:hypothetical protein n=1 Tax=Sphingomonas sp. 37zxx TaxID=1550073 RepID=UPI001E6299FC|nr:hypothetical protein [Sphingomonas sp. 37zxx]